MRIFEKLTALKSGLLAAVLFGLSWAFAFADDTLDTKNLLALRVSISPNRITENTMSNFVIHINGDERIRGVVEFPKVEGVTWYPRARGSSTSIVNGVKKSSVSYGFSVSKPGEITIPSMRVETSEGERQTRPVKFTVGKVSTGLFREDGSEMPISEAVFMHIQALGPERKMYFVGEEIPVLTAVLWRPDVMVALTKSPTLGSKNEALVVNETGQTQTTATLKGERYNAAVFSYNLRAMKAGTLELNADASAKCYLGNDVHADPFGDSFFGVGAFQHGFGVPGRSAVAVPLNAELGGIIVKARPPVPAGVIDLGIVSQETPTWTLSTESPKQGDPLYLDLKIRGNAAGLIPPEPKLTGFRTYPAEISKVGAQNPAHAETNVRMMLIPLNSGVQQLDLTFATLDPNTGKYRLTRVEKTLSVSENQALAAPAASTLVPLENDVKAQATLSEKSSIGYIRPITQKALERGKLPPNSGAFQIWGIPGIISLICLGVYYRRSRRENDPAELRRRRARSRKSELLKMLAESTPENFDALVRTEVTDYLADARGAISADDIRRDLKHKNAELAEVLESAESAGYNPNAHCGNFEKYRAIVVRAIKSGVFALAAFVGAWFAFPQEVRAAEDAHTIGSAIRFAEDAYAAGDFSKAQKEFSVLADYAPYSADVWFDLGNVFYQQKKTAPALVCYERAWRLDVGRADILSNLNAARVKLGLNPLGEVKNPLDGFAVLRDSFSQFTWSVFAAAVVTFGVIGITFVRRRRATIAVIVLVVAGFGIFNLVWQKRILENPTTAFVVTESASVYALPIKEKSAVREVAKLPAGMQVNILDTREAWYLVRFGETEGWTEKSAVARVWGDWTVPTQ